MDKGIKEKAEVAFIRARIKLQRSHPFWAYLSMRLELRWDEQAAGGLSCTDGKSMIINPTRFLALSSSQQVSIIVHETGHCAALHLSRRGSRDPLKWNVAGDMYLANMMEADDFDLVPASEDFLAQWGDRTSYKDMLTEAIYDALPDPPPQPQGGQGCTHWQGEGGCYRETPAGAQNEAAADWKQAVIEAGQLAGNAPGHWRELVDAAMPRLPFSLKLYEYLTRGLGGDSTFDSLNRRYIHAGLYLPNDTREVMGDVALVVDTSGSMSEEQLQLALGYVRTFREQHPCRLHLIQCDWDVPEGVGYRVYEEHELLPAEFEVAGRGGTSFDAPFKLLREKRAEPRVLVYFTDGYGAVSVPRPPYPVLWCIVRGDRGFRPDFGEVVYVGAGS